jgi:phosphoribosylformylglycinamidine synthase
VTGGNVSFYNESPLGAVYPTPTVGMVGLLDDVAHATRMTFRAAGESVVLLGEPTDELGASEYLARVHGIVAGASPRCDLTAERKLVDALLESIRAGVVRSAHDCSEGGLAVALAECCVADRHAAMGAEVDLSPWRALPLRAVLFGEAQGRVVLSTTQPEAVLRTAKAHGVPARLIGTTRPPGAGLAIRVGDAHVAVPLEVLADAWHGALPRAMSRAPAEALTRTTAAGNGATR